MHWSERVIDNYLLELRLKIPLSEASIEVKRITKDLKRKKPGSYEVAFGIASLSKDKITAMNQHCVN